MTGDLNAKSNYDGRVVPLDYMHFTLIGVMCKLGWRVIIIMLTVPYITSDFVKMLTRVSELKYRKATKFRLFLLYVDCNFKKCTP